MLEFLGEANVAALLLHGSLRLCPVCNGDRNLVAGGRHDKYAFAVRV